MPLPARSSRTLQLLTITLAVGVSISACAPRGTEPPKLIVLGWDGMPDWVVDSLLSEGKMPGLARLAREGARATHVTPGYPSFTAHGWSALYTGAYGDVTGATGNSVPVLPRSEHTLLESQSGHRVWVQQTDPIWMSAVRAGRRVLVLSANGFGELEDYQRQMQAAGAVSDQLVSYTYFGPTIAPHQFFDETVLRPASGWQGVPPDRVGSQDFSFAVSERVFHALVFGDPSRPGTGLNAAVVCPDDKSLIDPSRCAQLAPAPATTALDQWSRAFTTWSDDLVGLVYFRLFDLSPDGTRMTLYARAVSGLGTPTSDQQAILLAAGGAQQVSPVTVYADGAFGVPLWEGGDGTAERRMLEVAQLDAELTWRAIAEGLDRYEPDFLWHYSSGSDAAGHSLLGVLDPRSPRFDPEIADAVWPVYSELLGRQDWVLEQLLDHIDSSTIVTVVSDHGMAGVGRNFSANTVLEQAGLLARNPDGTVDLGATFIHGSWGGGFFLNVNSTEWRDGIVGPEQFDDVLDEATRALLSFIDPETGQAVVTHVFRPSELEDVGAGGPSAGDLYLDLAYGYHPRGEPASPLGSGAHGFSPARAEMHTIWFVSGGGIVPGQELPPVRLIDIAPTLANLIGIEVPRDARGLVVDQLLSTRD